MRIGRVAAVSLGILTMAPIAYLGFFLMVIGPTLFSFGSPGGIAQSEFLDLMRRVYGLHITAIILAFGLVAFYVGLVHRGDVVPPSKRSLWTLLLFVGNVFVMPVFWYLFVWSKTLDLPRT